MIDLRSDTVTRPTPAMRQAMAEAVVGDDVIDVDPTVEALEHRTAEVLGKEAALFMPSGSMANQIAVRVHCDRGTEFLCEADCHIYHYEQAAFAQLSGLVARTVQGEAGVLQPTQLHGLVRPHNDHMVRTRLVSLENTHNRGGGTIQPINVVAEICQWAAENDLRRHLDGARLWNAVAATGICEADWAAHFDSVSVCFSKGLGARFGAGWDKSFYRRGSAGAEVVRGWHAAGRDHRRGRVVRARASSRTFGRRPPARHATRSGDRGQPAAVAGCGRRANQHRARTS